MNVLQKLGALLAAEGRTIAYGACTGDEPDPLVVLSMGESLPARGYLGKGGRSEPTVLISVYHADHLAGYDVLKSVKAEIDAARKQTVQLVFVKDLASVYEKEMRKYRFVSQYKILNEEE